jgi:hypothetical protein
MKEDKENAYLTCPISERCYSKRHGEDLRKKALKTNDPSDWSKVPMATVLVDCFNMDCFMRKNYKQAMENIKEQRKNN